MNESRVDPGATVPAGKMDAAVVCCERRLTISPKICRQMAEITGRGKT